MLQALDFKVRFEKTNRVIEQSIKFQKGFGAIVGPNESGKSLVLEMIRYALFGSRALRGSMSDYHTLTADLVVSIRGVSYTVARSLKDTILYEGETEIAVGTKPVNTKIVELLGFGLEVFDISCVVMQGEVEKLGAMGGADRKRLVDSVIGMSVIEDMIKMSNEEANSFKRTIEAFQKALVKPDEPETPTGYHTGWEVEFNRLSDLKVEYDQLCGALSVPLQKVEVVEPYSGPSVEELQSLVEASDLIRTKVANLNGQIGNRQPATITAAVAQVGIDTWKQIEEQQALAAKVDAIDQQLREALDHLLTCPQCGNKFHVESDYVDRLTAERAALIDRTQEIKPPGLSRQEYENEIQRQDVAELILQRDAYQLELDRLPDYRTSLAEVRQSVRNYQDYLKASGEYEARAVARRKAEARRDHLGVELKLYHQAADDRKVFSQFEAVLGEYHKQLAAYEQAVASVGELEDQQRDWSAAKDALVILRGQIKQHLLPALNRWSSIILNLMTGGQRNNIVVDENFDIMVDNQPINTLSGSGKAVANLALRIGLGQVLTNGVLSLFIGDEIDASMDTNRAGNTAEALQTLRDSILQILIVSHKSVQADYYVDLGNDQQDTENDQ